MVRVFSSTQLFTTSAWNPACILATASSPLPNGSFTRCTFGYCSVKDLMYAGANPSLYEKSLRVPEIAVGPAEPPGGAELEPPPQAEAMSAAAVTTANGPNLAEIVVGASRREHPSGASLDGRTEPIDRSHVVGREAHHERPSPRFFREEALGAKELERLADGAAGHV